MSPMGRLWTFLSVSVTGVIVENEGESVSNRVLPHIVHVTYCCFSFDRERGKFANAQKVYLRAVEVLPPNEVKV